MTDFKSLFTSKTFWGAMISLASVIAGMFGYTIGAEDQVALADVVVSAGGIVGVVLTVWGRIVASKLIG